MRHLWRQRVATVAAVVLAAVTAGVLTASPAVAGTVNAGTFSVGAGSVGAVSTGTTSTGTTSTIEITSSRTILNWQGAFDLAAGSTLSFAFASSDHTVLIRLPGLGDTASIDGELGAHVGPPGQSTYGGNVWIAAPGGVDFGPSADVDTGGLLATTANLTDADFVDTGVGGTTTDHFVGSGSNAGVNIVGATITGYGGHLAFVAPTVVQSSGSSITGGARTDALFGGGEGFVLTLGAQVDGSRGILDFDVLENARSSRPSPVHLAGTVDVGNVYAVSDSSYTSDAGTGAAGPSLGEAVRASGAPASQSGTLAVVSGGGITRDDFGSPARATQRAAAVPQPITVDAALRGEYQTVVAASGDLTLHAQAALSGQQVALSTGEDLINTAGPGVISALSRWVIYAPTHHDVTGGLDSGTTAVWSSDLNSRPPSTVVGTDDDASKRYVFGMSPVVTFTADDKSKDFDTAHAAGAVVELTASTDDYVHPGVTGLFLGDTAPSYTGAPALSSDGAAHTAPQRQAGAYPIAIARGTLVSTIGYGFRLVPGELAVTDNSPPAVTATVTGRLGESGWYTSDVHISFDVVDLGSDVVEENTGCADRTLTADQHETTYTCTAQSFGGSTSVSTAPLKRDATTPHLVVPADVSATTAGTSAVVTWTAPTATDALDPAPTVTCAPASGTTFSVGTTPVTCSATDHAGNVTRGSFDVTVTAVTMTATFERPIDAAPMLNVAKLGRVIPVKVGLRLGDEPVLGPSSVPVHVGAAKVSCTTATADGVETYAAAGSSNTGNLFRWDEISGRWVYNLDTGALGATANTCYEVAVYYGGSVVDGQASGGALAGSFLLKLVR